MKVIHKNQYPLSSEFVAEFPHGSQLVDIGLQPGPPNDDDLLTFWYQCDVGQTETFQIRIKVAATGQGYAEEWEEFHFQTVRHVVNGTELVWHVFLMPQTLWEMNHGAQLS